MIYLFTAKWCGQCTPVKKYIEEKQWDVKIVDIDEDFTLAERYNVKSLPTFMIVDGDVVQSVSGANDILKFLKGE